MGEGKGEARLDADAFAHAQMEKGRAVPKPTGAKKKTKKMTMQER